MWISKKRHESLTSEIEDLKQELIETQVQRDMEKHAAEKYRILYNSAGEERNALLKNLAYDLRIRRAVVGGHGVGKTVFIKKQIIPQLGMDYYIFDLNDEYIDVPEENTTPMAFGAMSIKEKVNFIIETISQVPHRLYIFESIDAYNHDTTWFDMLIRSRSFNFIIVINMWTSSMDFLAK